MKSPIKRFKSWAKRKTVYDWVCISVVLITFIIVSVASFDSWPRLWQSAVYLWRCVSFYFVRVFTPREIEVAAPIYPILNGEGAADIISEMPTSYAEYVYLFRTWALSLINYDVFLSYFGKVLIFTLDIAQFVSYLPMILIFLFIFRKSTLSPDKDEEKGGETKALRRFRRVEEKLIMPARQWLGGLFTFLRKKENKRYIVSLFLVMAFGTDLLAAAVEIVSWYIYFVLSFNMQSFNVPMTTVLYAILPIIFALKTAGTVIVLFLIFLLLRHLDAIGILKNQQASNEEVLEVCGVAEMNMGPPRSGKTDSMSSKTIDGEKNFRNKYFDIIKEATIYFPEFPWDNLESWLVDKIQNHVLVNKAQVKNAIRKKWYDDFAQNFIDNVLKKPSSPDDWWGYNLRVYPSKRFDSAKFILLEDMVQAYGQAFFMYYCPKPLSIANYSIKYDFERKAGFFPLYNHDYFKLDLRDLSRTKYATNVNFDARRILVKKNPSHSEYWYINDGVVETYTEWDKERGNKDDHQGQKKMEMSANQINDGFNKSVKLAAHENTINAKTFAFIQTDTQREMSVNADYRDVNETKMTIKRKSKIMVALPFFDLEKAFYEWVMKKWAKRHFEYRNKRKIRSLPDYLETLVLTAITRYYFGLVVKYGYVSIDFTTERGGNSEMSGDRVLGQYYIIFLKMRAKTYNTAAYEELFDKNRLTATKGFYDAPMFKSYTASADELSQQESYFMDELFQNITGGYASGGNDWPPPAKND